MPSCYAGDVAAMQAQAVRGGPARNTRVCAPNSWSPAQGAGERGEGQRGRRGAALQRLLRFARGRQTAGRALAARGACRAPRARVRTSSRQPGVAGGPEGPSIARAWGSADAVSAHRRSRSSLSRRRLLGPPTPRRAPGAAAGVASRASRQRRLADAAPCNTAGASPDSSLSAQPAVMAPVAAAHDAAGRIVMCNNVRSCAPLAAVAAAAAQAGVELFQP